MVLKIDEQSPTHEGGGTIVRRFTDSLTGDSALSVGAKVASSMIEMQVEARDKMRTQLLYYEIDASSGLVMEGYGRKTMT